jgi:hypothetical protein
MSGRPCASYSDLRRPELDEAIAADPRAVPRYDHRTMVTNRNLSENPGKSS